MKNEACVKSPSSAFDDVGSARTFFVISLVVIGFVALAVFVWRPRSFFAPPPPAKYVSSVDVTCEPEGCTMKVYAPDDMRAHTLFAAMKLFDDRTDRWRIEVTLECTTTSGASDERRWIYNGEGDPVRVNNIRKVFLFSAGGRLITSAPVEE